MILMLGIIVAKCDSVIKQLRSKLLMKSRANIETILTSAITKRFISLESNEITTLGNIGLKTIIGRQSRYLITSTERSQKQH